MTLIELTKSTKTCNYDDNCTNEAVLQYLDKDKRIDYKACDNHRDNLTYALDNQRMPSWDEFINWRQ